MTALERAFLAFFFRAGTDAAARTPMISTTMASSRRLKPASRPSFREVDPVELKRAALDEAQVSDRQEKTDLRLQFTDAGGFKSVLSLEHKVASGKTGVKLGLRELVGLLGK